MASSFAALPAVMNVRTNGVGPATPSSAVSGTDVSAIGSSGAALLAQARASLSTAGPLSGPTWTIVAQTPPTTRIGESMAYDAKDKAYVLFGGWNPYIQVLGDTWELKANGIWSNVTSGTSPAPRWGAAIAYDAADGYVVLFGGQGSTLSGALADTWKFSGGAWTKLNPTTHPGGVQFGSMTYDAKDGYVVLFGGTNAAGATVRTTWEFKAGIWTQLHPAVSPPTRTESAMAFDAKDNYTVLFGGTGASAVLGDTWKFVAGAWTNITPAKSPPARFWSTMAYSATDSRVVLFGGEGSNPAFLGDTWTFAGGAWTKLASLAHPSKRTLPSMADGPSGGAVTLFGGLTTTGVGNDTWKISGKVWTTVLPQAPIPRFDSAMTYDEADGYVLLFGGTVGNGIAFGDTWKFVGGVWTHLHPSLSPSPRYEEAMTYDAADGYVVLFGGYGCGSTCADTWTFVHGTWTDVSVPGAPNHPSQREGAGLAYDYKDGYVVLFGGHNFTVDYGDTWAFLGGVWSPLYLTYAPSAREWMEMTYDSEDGYLLMVGGLSTVPSVNYLSDTWVYSSGNWTNLTASLSGFPPTYNALSAFFDDTYDGYMVLFMASSGTTYEFDGSSWSVITTSNSPPPSYTLGQGGAYDPIDEVGVVLTTQGSTWEYTG
ncbi:MAG TPA: kelch repeat-containing protein [Thermoplasmata archaeon]